MSRIAKGPLDPLFKSKRSRTIAKGGGLGLAYLRAVEASALASGLGGGFAQRQRLENTICQTPLRLTPGIVARPSKRSAKDYGRQ
jgi:hypothetical protein